MRRVVIGALVLVALAAAVTTAAVLAFRDDGDETVAEEPIRITPGSSSLGVYSSGESIAAPMPRLPGITVLGMGEVEVKPDVAFVRLTIGSGSPFGGSEGSVALLDEKEFEPVVDALVGAGAPKDDVYVDTFGGLGFGQGDGAANIAFKWPRPQEVKKALAVAQVAVRKHTDQNLQAVSVVFARDDCKEPERKAMDAALQDARGRAERIASLSHAKLGPLVAVSEATSVGSLVTFSNQRCGADLLHTPALFAYQVPSGTADEVTVSITLEVTFALER